jgi:septal ring-binding cell division protein DamX
MEVQTAQSATAEAPVADAATIGSAETAPTPAIAIVEAAPATSAQAAAASAPSASEHDVVVQRLAATSSWLASAHPRTYSIQLLGTAHEEQLRDHLRILSKYIETNSIFVYRTRARGKPSLTVLYGAYGDRQAAQAALAELPPALKAYGPILRTVEGVRGELRRLQQAGA